MSIPKREIDEMIAMSRGSTICGRSRTIPVSDADMHNRNGDAARLEAARRELAEQVRHGRAAPHGRAPILMEMEVRDIDALMANIRKRIVRYCKARRAGAAKNVSRHATKMQEGIGTETLPDNSALPGDTIAATLSQVEQNEIADFVHSILINGLPPHMQRTEAAAEHDPSKSASGLEPDMIDDIAHHLTKHFVSKGGDPALAPSVKALHRKALALGSVPQKDRTSKAFAAMRDHGMTHAADVRGLIKDRLLAKKSETKTEAEDYTAKPKERADEHGTCVPVAQAKSQIMGKPSKVKIRGTKDGTVTAFESALGDFRESVAGVVSSAFYTTKPRERSDNTPGQPVSIKHPGSVPTAQKAHVRGVKPGEPIGPTGPA